MSTNVTDELDDSNFRVGTTVTLVRSAGMLRSAVWQMDVSSGGNFYIQFAVIDPLPCRLYFSRPPFALSVLIIYNPS
jgi:hypothetical protein